MRNLGSRSLSSNLIYSYPSHKPNPNHRKVKTLTNMLAYYSKQFWQRKCGEEMSAQKVEVDTMVH